MLQNQRARKKEQAKKRNKKKDDKKKFKISIAGRESNKAMYTKSKKGQLSGPLGGGSSKSSLTLRKDAKDIIFDVLRKMDQLNVSRGSGTESDDKSSSSTSSSPCSPSSSAITTNTSTKSSIISYADVRKLEKIREKQEKSLNKQIEADKKLAKKNDKIEKRAAKRIIDPNSTKVRLNISICSGNGEKKTIVVSRSENLIDFLKTVKNKFNRKPNKIKKPVKAYLMEENDTIEMFNTNEMCDGDWIIICEKNQLPDARGGTDSTRSAGDVVNGEEKNGKGAKSKKSKEEKKSKKGKKSKKEKREDTLTDEEDNTEKETKSSKVETVTNKLERLQLVYINRCKNESSSNEISSGNVKDETMDRNQIETELKEQEYLSSSAIQNKIPLSMVNIRQSLPSYKQRNEIITTINTSSVVVISGETGCGKTTQIPQFILEDAIQNNIGGKCNILCTQPRRLSAVGVANRVAEERNEKIGDIVGYHIRLNKKISKRTRLIFCTTGILLRKIISNPNLLGITHIILDEVHEREILCDFLLIILKNLLITTRPDLKIILMSATVNAVLFGEYFNDINNDGGPSPTPVLNIPGRTFNVITKTFEDVIELLDGKSGRKKLEQQYMNKRSETSSSSSSSSSSSNNKVNTNIIVNERIPYDTIVRLVDHICTIHNNQKNCCILCGSTKHTSNDACTSGGAILIFLPGLSEITKLCQLLKSKNIKSDRMILPLHGSLTSALQNKVFNRAPPGIRKIVVSTNVAETSVTIEDVVYVIDTGRVKEIQYNASSNCPALVETWTSRASSKQRKGRAGRVRPGICYQMYPSYVYNDIMLEYQIPEIERMPLEQVVLQIYVMNLTKSTPEIFLQKALNVPNSINIMTAMNTLKSIGAINEITNTLTPLGYHLANLPVGAKIGKLLLYGCLFRCVEPILTIAASMSCKNPFISNQSTRKMNKLRKMEFSSGSSDLLTIARAYNAWSSSSSSLLRKTLCRDYYLSDQSMRMIRDTREQYRKHLKDIGFLSKNVNEDNDGNNNYTLNSMWSNENVTGESNSNGRDISLLRCVLCAALYPNVARIRSVDSRGNRSIKAPNDRYTTRTEEVFIHPGSINFNNSSSIKKEGWLIYNEKQMTTRMYMYDTNVVTPYSLFLFGNNLKYDYNNDVITVDEWIEFKSNATTFTLFKRLRDELERIWFQRIENPFDDNGQHEERIVIDAISTLLNTERSDNGFMEIGEMKMTKINQEEIKIESTQAGVCRSFSKNGSCRFGKSCRFKHVNKDGSVGGGALNVDHFDIDSI